MFRKVKFNEIHRIETRETDKFVVKFDRLDAIFIIYIYYVYILIIN